MYYQPKSDLLKNRIILVTGASDGIGREASLTYSHYGANVILLGRNQKKLQSVSEKIFSKEKKISHWFVLDLLNCNYNDCKKLAEKITNYYPRLDGILHNAALLGEICPMIDQNPKIWQDVIHTNVTSVFFLTKALLPLILKSKDGSLIFTSSSVGKKGRANWGAYSVSKFAIEGMMQILSEEYKNQNLRVNCINPGKTRTKMRASAFPNEDQKNIKDPSDIMLLYLWLMGNDSRFKNGMTFNA